ncbi:hypothetical protein AnigIFM60653_002815 [Aspergillus niger]|nr:hypothetical protein AnigIFM50267_000461 [Aspergillus niger]GLA03215.1 hypothetical protein AnigIFM60653_002815 [Aspergillus niger]
MASHAACFRCRARKVRCDRVRPRCLMCEKQKLDCERPSDPPRLRWLPPRTGLIHETAWEELSARRQPLFSGIALRTPPCPLIIYFYRCPYVQQTIHHLSEFDKQKPIAGDRSSNTCWPGFVAACKAIEPQTRQAFIRWLERSGEGTGIRMFNVALEAVRRVWHVRGLPGMQSIPWTRILGRSDELRVLVLS